MKNKILIAMRVLVLAFLASNSAAIFAFPPDEEKANIEVRKISFVQKAAFFFLDDSEHDIGAISDGLITALFQQPGPLIVSNTLLNNVIGAYHQDDRNVSDFMVQHEYIENKTTKNLSPKKVAFLRATKFNPAQWVIKALGHNLSLLIPHQYLAKLKISVDEVNESKLVGSATLSTLELSLGLKVNHLPNLSINDFRGQMGNAPYNADYLVGELANLFCSKSDYRKYSLDTLPIWSFFQLGHGLFANIIVGLTIDKFKQVLDFFEHEINTDAVVIASCYAAGANEEAIYQDVKTGMQKTYAFAIITQAISDSVTSGPKLVFRFDSPSNSLKLFNQSSRFDEFMRLATTSRPLDYPALTLTVMPILPDKEVGPDLQKWHNLPQIKLPGLPWFSALAGRKDLVSIGALVGKARDKSKPLSGSTFFKSNPRAILLFAKDVLFEIIVDSPRLEAIISMIPGEASHRLKKLSSSKHNLEKILSWFMSIRMLDPQKVFFIEEISAEDQPMVKDVIIYNQKTGGGLGLAARPEQYSYQSFYTIEDQVYKYGFKLGENATWYQKEKAQPADAQEEVIYSDLVAKARGEVKKLGIISLKTSPRGDVFGISNIDRTAIVEKISSTDPMLSIGDIAWAIHNNIFGQQASFVWIKELTFNYSPTDLNLPEVARDTAITVNDVIVDSKIGSKEFFFSFAGKFYQGKKPIESDYRSSYQERLDLALATGDGQISRTDLAKIAEALQKKRISLHPDYEEKASALVKLPAAESYKSDVLSRARWSNDAAAAEQQLSTMNNLDVSIVDKVNGNIPLLHWAIEWATGSHRSPASLKLATDLINRGINVSVKHHGANALISAMSATSYQESAVRPDLAILLVNKGGLSNENYISRNMLLGQAIKTGSHQLIALFIEQGGNVNGELYKGMPVLMAALSQPDVVELMIKKQVNVNVKDSNNQSALASALSLNQFNTAKLLLKAGADVNVNDQHGRPLLYNALIKSDAKFTRLLLEHGAKNVNAIVDGRPLSHWAVTRDHTGRYDLDNLKLLLDAGADISAIDTFGYSIIGLVAGGYEEYIIDVLKMLMARGAKATKNDIKNASLLEVKKFLQQDAH